MRQPAIEGDEVAGFDVVDVGSDLEPGLSIEDVVRLLAGMGTRLSGSHAAGWKRPPTDLESALERRLQKPELVEVGDVEGDASSGSHHKRPRLFVSEQLERTRVESLGDVAKRVERRGNEAPLYLTEQADRNAGRSGDARQSPVLLLSQAADRESEAPSFRRSHPVAFAERSFGIVPPRPRTCHGASIDNAAGRRCTMSVLSSDARRRALP